FFVRLPPLSSLFAYTTLFRSHAPERASAWKGVVSVLAAADELATHTEVDSMLRRAVELARECIGLERAALYLLDPSAAPRHVLRDRKSRRLNSSHVKISYAVF